MQLLQWKWSFFHELSLIFGVWSRALRWLVGLIGGHGRRYEEQITKYRLGLKRWSSGKFSIRLIICGAPMAWSLLWGAPEAWFWLLHWKNHRWFCIYVLFCGERFYPSYSIIKYKRRRNRCSSAYILKNSAIKWRLSNRKWRTAS